MFYYTETTIIKHLHKRLKRSNLSFTAQKSIRLKLHSFMTEKCRRAKTRAQMIALDDNVTQDSEQVNLYPIDARAYYEAHKDEFKALFEKRFGKSLTNKE